MRRLLAAVLAAALMIPAAGCTARPAEPDEPNAVTYAAMEAAEKGEDMFGPFDSVGDLMEALNA